MMQEPLIAVGIMADTTISFELLFPFKIDESNLEKGHYKVALCTDKMTLSNEAGDELINSNHIYLKGNDKSRFVLKNVTIGINFHWEQQENQTFKGDLELTIIDGKIQAINHIQLENYLLSVISSEMSATSNTEFLKTHAIISRSWLMAQLENSKKHLSFMKTETDDEIITWFDREDHTHFDVCADDHCQRYQGVSKASTDAVRSAIKSTRGLFLTYNNTVCDARFYKCCGGATEHFEDVWQPEHHPYLIKVWDGISKSDIFGDLRIEDNAKSFILATPDVYCNTSDEEILSQVLNDFDQSTADFFRWKISYSQKELSALIRKRSGIDFGVILDLIPLERGKSGRILKLKIVGTKRTILVGKELLIRKYLSESHLYSSAFIVEKYDSDQFTIKGAGWGHGVGLCQIGAAVMSVKGFSNEEILQHYFPNSVLERLYE